MTSTIKNTDSSNGFSLIEVTLALAIIAIMITSLFALFSIALNSGADADQKTVVGLILEDAVEQIKGIPLSVATSNPDSGLTADLEPLFYTLDGTYISKEELDNPSPDKEAFHRVDFSILVPNSVPEEPTLDFDSVTGNATSGLRAVKFEIFWPVDPVTGEKIPESAPQKTYSFMVSTLSGTDWENIDPSYVPKVEF